MRQARYEGGTGSESVIKQTMNCVSYKWIAPPTKYIYILYNRHMNFIEENRKIAIEENTAQPDFLTFLENLDPQLSDIIVRDGLSGDLDLNVLRECNFKNITSLQFSKGNITSLKNIPDGITRLLCPQNLLQTIVPDDLPTSLVELNLSENGIKRIDALDHLVHLKELNLSNNQLSFLDKLPKNLEIL